MVGHEQAGLLVPVRDPAALVSAIDRMAGDAAARRRLEEAAVAMAREEFDQRRVIARTLEAYSLLGTQG